LRILEPSEQTAASNILTKAFFKTRSTQRKTMIRKNMLAVASLTAAIALSGAKAYAQDVHFTQFEAAPLTINPAFTGAFDGTVRVAGVYRDQWRSVTAPFVTYSASVDAPIRFGLAGDDYLAGGLQFYNDKAGDGNLSNTSILGSVAYHKFLGGTGDGAGDRPGKTLSVGFQAGYCSKSIDLSKLYFGNEFMNGGFNPGLSGENLNNKVHYWVVNAGIAWAHAVSEGFSYTIGLGANNLNQPRESLEREKNSEVGLGMRYTAQLGAVARVSDRLRLMPAVLYQSQASATELVAGNEFNYAISNSNYSSISTAVFLGIYYRNNDAMMGTAGIDWKGFRFGVSYDYNTSSLKDASNGNGGFEISIRYIAPNPLEFSGRRGYPCARF
jgi:type IX secretion system PorP/SprF family membrane protein